MELAPPPIKHAKALGVACGAGAALCWALGFVAARHGIDVGVSPLVLALHRYAWPGLVLLPFLARSGLRDLGGLGWGRGFTLAVFGGLPLALLSYLGYLFVPLGHGGIIQPSCAALGGMTLARVVLKEPLPAQRVVGAIVIVARTRGDRRRSVSDHRRPRSRRRSPVCCGRMFLCHLRHAGAAVADRGDAGGRPSPASCRSSACRSCCSASTT